MQKNYIFEFIRRFIGEGDEELALTGLLVIRRWLDDGWKCPQETEEYLASFIPSTSPCQMYLICRIRERLERSIPSEDYDYSTLFRENLKSDFFWAKKVINLEIIHTIFIPGDGKEKSLDLSVYASHLLHVLRLNTQQEVFLTAGERLVELIPFLSEHQKYQIIQEILKAIELRDDSTNYIPSFLGRTILYLDEQSLRELSVRMKELSVRKTSDTVNIILETACVIAGLIPGFVDRYPDKEKICLEEYRFCLGLVATGLFSYQNTISEESLLLAGKFLFGTDDNRTKNCDLIKLTRKIVSSFDTDFPEKDSFRFLMVFQNIAGYLESIKDQEIYEEQKDIALISGPFNPFTLSDRWLVNEITDAGYQVFVNVHDYCRTTDGLPPLIRRKIAALSIADLPDALLLPVMLPVKEDVPEDLNRLCRLMPGRNIYIVTGKNEDNEQRLPRGMKYLRISDVHNDHDISITSSVRNMLRARNISIPNHTQEKDITTRQPTIIEIKEHLERNPESINRSWFFVETKEGSNKIRGCAYWHEISDISSEKFDKETTSLLSEKLRGLCLRIDILEVNEEDKEEYMYLLLNELLIKCQERGYSYAVCYGVNARDRIISAFGFQVITPYCSLVCLNHPLILFSDTTMLIKGKYRGENKVVTALKQTRLRLRSSLKDLYPGNLILYFDSDYLKGRMERFLSGVHDDSICVPFGKILRPVQISGKKMMPLHVEKEYEADLSGFQIRELPDYPELSIQIRALKSFHTPLILMDDLYHKGYRLNKLDEVIGKEQVDVKGVVVGILSGRGSELADKKGKTIEACYNVPGLRAWLVESEMYPFIGGDGLSKNGLPMSGDVRGIPSINTLLPYQMPSFLEKVSKDALYRLSMVCIENAEEIYTALEETYLFYHKHVLTLENIGEVINEVRYPAELHPDESMKKMQVSEILAMEKKRLQRLRGLVK